MSAGEWIPTDERRLGLPPRALPILYFGFAYFSFAIACLAVAIDARAVAGFFYHARMLAIVHLVTLGWITSSILGAIYIVGPIALRTPLLAGRVDYWACAVAIVGVIGMVTHFWIGQTSGMAWSAVMVVAALLWVAVRVMRGLARAPISRGVPIHLWLAFGNVVIAGTLGILIGFDKEYHFLPGSLLSNVIAHAHLAAVGWATMMVVGVGYRLLPMVLPAAMPSERGAYLSAALLEIGVLGLFVALLARSFLVPLFACLVVAGVSVFLTRVVWMARHRRAGPIGLKKPDYAVFHAASAFSYLVAASGLGLSLATLPGSEWTLRAAWVYGVFGLVGFLGQMVIGMEGRLLPMFAWYWAFANTDFRGDVAPPHDMPIRRLQQACFYVWQFAVPCVAGGLFFNAVPFLAAGAWALLLAVLLSALNAAAVLRHAYLRRTATVPVATEAQRTQRKT